MHGWSDYTPPRVGLKRTVPPSALRPDGYFEAAMDRLTVKMPAGSPTMPQPQQPQQPQQAEMQPQEGSRGAQVLARQARGSGLPGEDRAGTDERIAPQGTTRYGDGDLYMGGGGEA